MIKYLILFLVIIVLLFIIFHQELIKIPSYQIETFNTDSCFVRNQEEMNVNMERCNIYYTNNTSLCDLYPELYKLSIYQLTKLNEINTDPVQYNGKSYTKDVINSIIIDKTSNKLSICNFKPDNLYEIIKKDGDINNFTNEYKRQFGCLLPLNDNDIVGDNISDNIISKYGSNINNSCISGTNKTPITNIKCVGTNCPVSNKFHVITNFDNIQNNYNININNDQIFLKIYNNQINVAFVKYNNTTNTLVNINYSELSTITNIYDTFYEIKYKNPTPNTREYPREPITNYTTKYSDNTVFNVMASSGIDVFNIFNNSDNGWNTEPSRINTYINNYSGEFLKFDLGEYIVLKNFDLYPNSQNQNRSPKNFRIYATNNDNSYRDLTKSGVIIKENDINNKEPINININNNNYYYYAFTNTGTNNSINFLKDTVCDILIVGGGGAGAAGKGGGSSGGILYYTNITMQKDIYNITVGSGGKNQSENGSSSKISKLNNDIAVAIGGRGATSSVGATGSGNNINNINSGTLVINKIALAGGTSGNNYTPVRVYPPAPIGLTNDISVRNKTLSNLDYGNGEYKISWSSGYGWWDMSHIFDGVDSNGAGGHSIHDVYNNNGNYTSNKYLVNGYNGEWVILKLPYSIYLSYVKIHMRNGFASRAPYNYKIYGKNGNEENWTEIINKENAVYTNTVHTSDIVDLNTSFNTYGIVVNKIGLNANGNMLNYDELEFYGKELNNFDSLVEAFKPDGKKILPQQIPQSNDFYYAFTSTSGTNTIKFSSQIVCDILVVGGGGAGYRQLGGGGGGGAVIYIQGALLKGTYSIVIGSGGTTGSLKGVASSFGNMIAEGGGAGGSFGGAEGTGNRAGKGGSGGGAAADGANGAPYKYGGLVGTSSSFGNFSYSSGIKYGNMGGNGLKRSDSKLAGGGGGGAGTAGQDGNKSFNNIGGNGGNGIQINIDGRNFYWGGGGGGSSYFNSVGNVGGNGGIGGGGGGAPGSINGTGGTGGGSALNSGGNKSGTDGGAGGANTGGGGGGGGWWGNGRWGYGGNGGSGIVIIRVRATQNIIGSGGGGGIQSNGNNSIGGSPLINNITGTRIPYASGGNGFTIDNISSQQEIGLYGNGGNSSKNNFDHGVNGVVIIRWQISPIDMNNWIRIYEHNPPSIVPTIFKNYMINNTAPYRYYAIVVNKNWIDNNYGCSISKLKLFGYQQSLTERRVIIPPAIYASPKNFNSDVYLFTFDKNNKISEYDKNTINFSLTNFKKNGKYITDKLLNTNDNTPEYGVISRTISEYINNNNNSSSELNLLQIDAKIVEYNNVNTRNKISNSLTHYKNYIYNDIDISGMTFENYESYNKLSNGKFYLSNDDNIYIKL